MASKPRSSGPHAVTRADLATAVYDRATLSRKEALELVEMTIGEIADTLSRGEDVKLASFGAFVVRSKRERVGRNPKTGVEAKIAARRVVMFKASQYLRDRVAGAREPEVTQAINGGSALSILGSAHPRIERRLAAPQQR